MTTWYKALVGVYLAWRVCAKRRRRFAILEEAIDLKKEDLARLGFVYSILSLSLSMLSSHRGLLYLLL